MKLFRLIIITLVILFLGGIFMAARNATTFRVTSINPSSNRVPTATIYVNFEFNKELSEVGLDKVVTSEPLIVRGVELHGKRLRIKLDTLDDGKNYSIKLRNISATDGKVIDFYDYSFTARYIPFESLSKEEQQAILDDQAGDKKSTTDTIFGHVPYGGLHFKLTATTDGQSVPVLTAQILLSKVDVVTDRDVAITEYKQEVLDYIQSKNLDPNSYQINYEIIEPSIY